MIRRIVCALALLAPLLMLGSPAQPAHADLTAEANAAQTNVDAILNNDFNGSTFNDPSIPENCPKDNQGGACWWWSAVTYMALITYADENPSTSEHDQIVTDLGKTWKYICQTDVSLFAAWGQCATGPDGFGTDPFTINTNNATYFDDIGWWATTWLAAYKLTGDLNYLYVAEELWNYVTVNGYKWAALGCSGIPQYHKWDSNGNTVLGAEDTFANALYLRDSAWLYAYTQVPKYMEGTTTSWSGNSIVGGAKNSDNWIKSHLIFNYNGTAPGNSGARFLMAGQVDATCQPVGNQTFLHAQGAMVSAWTEMSKACSTAGANCSSAIYYDHLAEELARSVVYDQLDSNCTKPVGVDYCWPYDSNNQTYSIGQREPTVDKQGTLSEMCIPSGSAPYVDPQDAWPGWCDTGTTLSNGSSWLIAKGVFERAVYCIPSTGNVTNDTTLSTFIQTNANQITSELTHYGFLWDNTSTNTDPVNFATRASIIEALDGDLGQNQTTHHYGMC